MKFDFDRNGDLIVDGVYYDPRYWNSRQVEISGSWYFSYGNQLYKSGKEFAESLVPVPNYSPAESMEMGTMQLAKMALHCVYRSF